MFQQANDYLVSAKQDNSSVNNDKERNSNNSSLSTIKPKAVWQSPEFEEFDLCMEVTAYVQQWD